ncbi:MAG: prepilin peptidase [Candidatus Omnitrophica bacterium]|nr:prepilin peptidase [Candidatus Omnitrophota bacterium]
MTIVFVFILGAIAGSFMNVCICRLPRKESIISPGSHCPACGTHIKWYDNIPLLSFLFLAARCRHCGKRISFRYFIVEFVSGALAALLFLKFGLTPKFFASAYLAAALIVVSFIDLAVQEIPDEITLSGIVVGIVACVGSPDIIGRAARTTAFFDSFGGMLLGGLSIYIVGFIGEFILKKEAMGGGDVKLMAMIGAFLGWKLVFLTFWIAPFFGGAAGIVLKMKDRENSVIPYGPYISLAALVSLFFGEEILRRLFLL